MRPPTLLHLLLAALLALASFPFLADAAFADRSNTAAADGQHFYAGQRIVPGQFFIEVEQDEGDGDGGLAKRAEGAVALLDNVLSHLATPPSSSSSSSSRTGKPFGRTLHLPALSAVRTLTVRPSVFAGAVVGVDDEGKKSLLAGGEKAVGKMVEGLQAVKGVKRAWPLRLIPRPGAVLREDVPAASGSLSSSAISSLLSTPGTSSGEEYAKDTFSPHVMTGVDKLHREGKLGAGVKIGIIDTGVDYLNPILGGCFGSGCPVSFGASFVNSSGAGSSASEPTSGDPYTNCTQHGTHVTGIVTARANALGFSGVAPEAEVGHYRIFDCTETTGEDVVVAALLQASEDNCDVISMSLGSNVGWLGASPSQVVVERLTKSEGRTVVVSAGNDRAEGLFFASSPASGTESISVGSVDVVSLTAFPLVSITPSLSLPYLSPSPIDLSSLSFSVPKRGLRLYFTSDTADVDDDACDALPEDTPNLSKLVTVIKRGTCTFAQKVSVAQAKGAQIILVYDSPSTGGLIPYLTASSYPGLPAIASLRYFSEYGPTFELLGQPSLTAPGGNILSTFPISMGSVGVISGTSMSCPFVAGVTALLLSARRDLNLGPRDVRALLATTAKRTMVSLESKTVDSVISQGGGLIQVDKALATGTFLSPYEIQLNDTAFFAAHQTLTVRNTNSHAMLYSFSSSSAEGLATYDTSASSDVLPSTSPSQLAGTAAPAARVTFSNEALFVPAGHTGTVTATFRAPRFARGQAARFPFFSGYVEVEGKAVGALKPKTEHLSVPFFGLGTKMSEMPVLDTTATIYGDIAYPFIATGSNYQTKANAYGFTSGFDIYTRMAGGSRLVTIDLILASTPFRATISSERAVSSFASSETSERFARFVKRDPLPAGLSLAPSADSLLSGLGLDVSLPHRSAHAASSTSPKQRRYADTPIVGNIDTRTLVARDYLVKHSPLSFSETVTTFVPSEADFADALDVGGKTKYRVLIRALKITADPALEASYESYLSFPFTLSS
ncbi:hypothetical protein JCM10213v2_004668 [Rhodosporidiobolus nylandii]